MIYKVLDGRDALPAGGPGRLVRFTVVPVAGEEWRAALPGAVFMRGRVVETTGPGFKGIDVGASADGCGVPVPVMSLAPDGALAQAEARCVFEFTVMQKGETVKDGTKVDLVVGFGFPVAIVTVLDARGAIKPEPLFDAAVAGGGEVDARRQRPQVSFAPPPPPAPPEPTPPPPPVGLDTPRSSQGDPPTEVVIPTRGPGELNANGAKFDIKVSK